MPRDLFGDVTRPSISIGSHSKYTVPVSLASHAGVVLVLVALPILAPAMMPEVFSSTAMPDFVKIVPPSPPPMPRKIDPKRVPVENPHAAPIEAPSRISPESEPDLSWQDTPGPGVVGVVDQISDVITAPPAAPAPEQRPIRVGGTIRSPMKTHNVNPTYPAIAQAARVQGTVIIEATIDADGRITHARVLRSIPLLDQAALDAVRQWEYTPTLLNGVPVPVIMTVTVTFTLQP